MPLISKDRTRDRLVIFRVSQDEYDSLRSACVAANGRSISDYMRAELLHRPEQDPVAQKFTEIDRKLDELRGLLEAMSQRIDRPAD